MIMKAFVITIKHNNDSHRSALRTVQSAKEVGYKGTVELFDAILPHNWKEILPYKNRFHEYARPDNVGACFASHYLLWKKCIELNEPILILEHDAIFVNNLPDIDIDMCVNFGRPSYIRPDHIIFEEPKDGLNTPVQINFLGHHAYAIAPKAAKIFCNDVEKRQLAPNDIWIDTEAYPWLKEYRPYPIHADTDFSTIQTALPEDSDIMKKYYEVTDPNNPQYEYLLKHFKHVILGPQSRRHIDTGRGDWEETSPGFWKYDTYAWLRQPPQKNKYLLISWRMSGSEFCKEVIRENFPETVNADQWSKSHITLTDSTLSKFIDVKNTKVFLVISDPREIAINLIHFDNGIHNHTSDYKVDITKELGVEYLNELVEKQINLINYYKKTFGENCIVLKYEDAIFNQDHFIIQVAEFLKLTPLFIDDARKYKWSIHKNVGYFHQFFDDEVLLEHYNQCQSFYEEWGYDYTGYQECKYQWHSDNSVQKNTTNSYKEMLKRNGITLINSCCLTYNDKELYDRVKDIDEY